MLSISKLQTKIEVEAVKHSILIVEKEKITPARLLDLQSRLMDLEIVKRVLLDFASEKADRIVKLEKIMEEQQDLLLVTDHPGSDLGVIKLLRTDRAFNTCQPLAIRSSSLRGIETTKIGPIDHKRESIDKYYQNIIQVLQRDNNALRRELERKT